MWLGVWLAGLACLLLPPTTVGQRDRREVHKRAQPPSGASSGPGDVAHRESGPSQTQFLDVRKLLQLVLSQSNENGHAKRGQPELSHHMDASMAELVAVQTLQGDVAWIEARFVNESHKAGHRHRTRPYTLEERMALILPVAAFLLPFIVWISCMLSCIRRSADGKAGSY